MTDTLRDVIHVLTRPHAQLNGDRVAYVEPLFDTLRSLIHPSAAQKADEGGGGGGGGSRPPLNLDAVSLWQEIKTRIDREWPYAGHPSAIRVPTDKKLHAWHANTAQPHEALHLYDLCKQWEARIRELQTRTKKMPLSGECPGCQKTHVETVDELGDVKFNTAIIAYPDSQPVYAECQVCSTKWEGPELHELAANLH